MKKLTLSEKQKLCDEWNEKYPIGTSVVVTDDFGEEHQTITRSEAELLGEHTPVIWTEWKPCYLLSRVRVT